MEDLTWVSATDGWALGTAPCSHGPCTSIAHTTDGGQTWTALPAPSAYIPNDPFSPHVSCPPAAVCVTGIRFATASIGYVFGQGPLWTTVDGGASWSAGSAADVASLEIDDGSVYRVVDDGSVCPPGCDYQLQRSTLGSSSWTTLSTPPMPGDKAQLNVDGANLYVTVYQNPAGGAQSEQATVYRSTNAGATWSTSPDPCGTHAGVEDDAVDTTTAPGGYLFVGCQPRFGNGQNFIVASSDAGASFGPAHALPTPTLMTLAAPTPSEVLVDVEALVNGREIDHLLRSTDGGSSWNAVLSASTPSPVPSIPTQHFLGFENASDGHFVQIGTTVWNTTNSGASWSAHRFT